MNLDEATELGALLFTQAEIHTIMNATPSTLPMAILKGQLMTQAEIRRVTIAQAKAGSGEAQKLVEKWLLRLKIAQNE